MNHGKSVLQYIKNQPGGVTAFAERIGYDRSNFYYNCNQEPLNEKFIAALKKAGIDPMNLPGSHLPKDCVEIPVVLDSGKAIIFMPKGYTSKDMKKLVRVLEAYT